MGGTDWGIIMKRNILALASAAIMACGLSLLPSPSHAQTWNGMAFYNQCGNAFQAGFANRAFCHTYLLGFAAALQSTGQICMQRGTTDVQIVMVVQNWLRFHAQNLGNPANIMIRNALLQAWPCQRQ
jgi:hypothetical protein